MATAFIGLGSNLGDRLANLAAALNALETADGVHIAAVSHVYETEPWGVADQPPFANAVARLRTTLQADALLTLLLATEDVLGRERGVRYGPRVIDLDLLLYGDEEWASDRLVVPHPRLAERQFVVVPLLELAPEAHLPSGARIDPGAATEGRITGVLGTLPGYGDRTGGPTAEVDWVPIASGWPARFGVDMPLSILRDAGIPAMPRFEPWLQKYGGFMMGSVQPIDILVPLERADEARALLRSRPGEMPVVEGPPPEGYEPSEEIGEPAPSGADERPADGGSLVRAITWLVLFGVLVAFLLDSCPAGRY